MHQFYKNFAKPFIAGVLVFATLQFFVPLLNAAASGKCCDSQKMQCCQKQFPSRMVCCVSDTAKGLDDAAPLQALAPGTQKSPQFIVLICSANEPVVNAARAENFRCFPTSNLVTPRQPLYKTLSTFLI